ncbi:MAG: cyclic 2,3-diphosphoglycerate synthase, partial [Desulfurococcales archaeon]|nr:cyclic 2,3-diphosphoglycerate synthase [Desulfurococcales archaeon]
MAKPKRVVIMGAGGRDFHNFNVVFRDNPDYEVVAFTSTQIPGIEGRRYPPELAGPLYPSGIPIVPEEELERIVKENNVDLVVLAYSDLLYDIVGRKMSAALGAGASFMILGPNDTMLLSAKPVLAVTAVRTGAGKSSVSREVVRILREKGYRVVPVRHPMAYGNLAEMAVQRFETLEDLDKYKVTIEEREEYEHYINNGVVVYAGVDYGRILEEAEKEADIILWDGGNNDWPFYKPDYMIVVADAMRPGHEVSSFPGEVNVRMADAVIINKADQASKEAVETIKKNVREVNPRAKISVAVSEVVVDNPDAIRGKKVVVVEDSPTVTHGGSPYGAGYVAAKKYGAEIVDPKPYAKGIIAEMYREYKHMGPVVPSTGYSPEQ